MDDLNIIDQFTTTFVNFIETGFGLLGPDVAFLTAILIGIDITLAGLFWALSDDRSVIPSLIKKVLYVGAFAYIINNFALLANIIFNSFAGLGLRATSTSLTAADLLRPGFIAAQGYTAAEPLLNEVSNLVGPIAFFTNFPQIVVLMFAWAIVLIAFFILSIQLFITILEFKLTTLAGFVLVPFALWNKTSFLAEKVLGNVVSSGLKLMVLAVIVGIGATVFNSFTSTAVPGSITLEQALATVLASLALLMLGIFGPGVAAGLISGAPQLGAGAVAATTLGAGVATVAAGRTALGGAQLVGSGVNASVKAGASVAGGTLAVYDLGRATSGKTGIAGAAAGVSSVAQAGVSTVAEGAKDIATSATAGVRDAYQTGARRAYAATGGDFTPPPSSGGEISESPSGATPDWAQRIQQNQNRQHRRDAVVMTAHAIREGDRPAAGSNPNLKDDS